MFGGRESRGEKSLGLNTGTDDPEKVRISPDQLNPNVWTSALNLIYGLILKNNLL